MPARSTMTLVEDALRQPIARMDYAHADPTTFFALADLLEEDGQNADGYRRLAECIQARALLSACRVTAAWEAGISPLDLAERVASHTGFPIAVSNEVRFVCGPERAVKEHPDVDKVDRHPAINASRLPAPYRTEAIRKTLWTAAFNTARLRDQVIYVFIDLKTLLSTLSRLTLPRAV